MPCHRWRSESPLCGLDLGLCPLWASVSHLSHGPTHGVPLQLPADPMSQGEVHRASVAPQPGEEGGAGSAAWPRFLPSPWGQGPRGAQGLLGGRGAAGRHRSSGSPRPPACLPGSAEPQAAPPPCHHILSGPLLAPAGGSWAGRGWAAARTPPCPPRPGTVRRSRASVSVRTPEGGSLSRAGLGACGGLGMAPCRRPWSRGQGALPTGQAGPRAGEWAPAVWARSP